MAANSLFPYKDMDVYKAAREHFGWCIGVVRSRRQIPAVVRDQLLRASLSVPANIGEANGRWKRPGEVEQHYRYAQGSTYESAALLDALVDLTAIDDEEYRAGEERLERIARMLTGLMNRQTTTKR